ncbi:MAG: hypothetical protein ACYC9R_06495 [Nitrosotalea sp.]
MYPLDLLINYLKQVDEVRLLELLDITSEDLIRVFRSRIQAKRKYLESEVEIMPIDDTDRDEEDYGDDLTDDDSESEY